MAQPTTTRDSASWAGTANLAAAERSRDDPAPRTGQPPRPGQIHPPGVKPATRRSARRRREKELRRNRKGVLADSLIDQAAHGGHGGHGGHDGYGNACRGSAIRKSPILLQRFGWIKHGCPSVSGDLASAEQPDLPNHPIISAAPGWSRQAVAVSCRTTGFGLVCG